MIQGLLVPQKGLFKSERDRFWLEVWRKETGRGKRLMGKRGVVQEKNHPGDPEGNDRQVCFDGSLFFFCFSFIFFFTSSLLFPHALFPPFQVIIYSLNVFNNIEVYQGKKWLAPIISLVSPFQTFFYAYTFIYIISVSTMCYICVFNSWSKTANHFLK